MNSKTAMGTAGRAAHSGSLGRCQFSGRGVPLDPTRTMRPQEGSQQGKDMTGFMFGKAGSLTSLRMRPGREEAGVETETRVRLGASGGRVNR